MAGRTAGQVDIRCVVESRARTERVSPAEAAQRIVTRHHKGDWSRWAAAYRLTVDEVREVVAELEAAAEVGSDAT